jgi:hypothetical protein
MRESWSHLDDHHASESVSAVSRVGHTNALEKAISIMSEISERT